MCAVHTCEDTGRTFVCVLYARVKIQVELLYVCCTHVCRYRSNFCRLVERGLARIPVAAILEMEQRTLLSAACFPVFFKSITRFSYLLRRPLLFHVLFRCAYINII
jgi:hypothetical protein